MKKTSAQFVETSVTNSSFFIRTTLMRTITQYELLILLGSNHLQCHDPFVSTAKHVFRVSSTDAEYGQSHTLQASTEQDKKQWLNAIRSVIPHPENYKTYLWCHARLPTSRNDSGPHRSVEKNLNAQQRVDSFSEEIVWGVYKVTKCPRGNILLLVRPGTDL